MAFDVSIIIINYNTTDYTINCIESIFKHTTNEINCEYLIIDNGSEAESFHSLKKYINTVSQQNAIKLIRSHINTGFGGGNMIGVNEATGKYLAFINNDVLFKNDCLRILKNFMDTNKNVGVCGPQAFKENGDILPTIDHFASLGRELLGRKVLEIVNSQKYPKRKKTYNQPQKGQFVAGSFMFFNANNFNSIGGFDTNIFLYHEETDVCKRLTKLNKEAFLVPEAQFIHFHGASTPKSVALKIELKISLLYVIRKHYGLISFFILLLYLQLKYFLSSLFKPKNWPVFIALIKQVPLSISLKHKQQIHRL
ncbi:glycosyltransferase family 2 protein [Sabulilitoribacter multivorans]|uniref:Glycosyltransferase family 2 protein n=1 Tax=Flaviramulus multivorans TaxID=1304750 RepID=A0ABS9IMD6_9FLAO|nr:glycosyltransferase family 2 protein [Flaviramulus multivorans]MCF7561768.1 glycosyltransferase family 2 protein [Flaviramulus multivorans]